MIFHFWTTLVFGSQNSEISKFVYFVLGIDQKLCKVIIRGTFHFHDLHSRVQEASSARGHHLSEAEATRPAFSQTRQAQFEQHTYHRNKMALPPSLRRLSVHSPSLYQHTSIFTSTTIH